MAKEKLDNRLKELIHLDKIDTSGVEPIFHVFENETMLREDEEIKDETISLKNAPKVVKEMIEVPKTV